MSWEQRMKDWNHVVNVGDLVRWTGEQGWKPVKTGSVGIVLKMDPWRVVDFDVLFEDGSIMTCHKKDLVILQKGGNNDTKKEK